MTMLAIPFPDFNPVALELGPFAIKWYGLAYMAGLVLGWLYIRGLLVNPQLWPRATAPFDIGRTDDLLLFMTVGVVLGGRLGGRPQAAQNCDWGWRGVCRELRPEL